jgi:predicted porin
VLAALKYTDFSARRMVTAGVTQELSPAFRVSFNYWRTFQTGKTPPQDGTASQFEILCDYSLSKRTDVYVESNYSLYRGGLIGAQLQGLNAASVAQKGTQLGAMVGMRHAF